MVRWVLYPGFKSLLYVCMYLALVTPLNTVSYKTVTLRVGFLLQLDTEGTLEEMSL